jgi:hypothetical protein
MMIDCIGSQSILTSRHFDILSQIIKNPQRVDRGGRDLLAIHLRFAAHLDPKRQMQNQSHRHHEAQERGPVIPQRPRARIRVKPTIKPMTATIKFHYS